MPKEGAPLPSEEVARIRRWIAEGAVWPAHVVVRQTAKADGSWWSLQPLVATDPPQPDGLPEDWQFNPIDRWVYAELSTRQLRPNPPADRRTLIRRATYDLTGLPPSPEEVAAFVDHPEPNAYEQLIDRLLASPQYGEHWGRHWLDVLRFGESNGYERNVIIDDLWPFRDYVIRSLNNDIPFDQLVREHLAGDVLKDAQPDQMIGSAFLVAGPYDDVGNQDAAQAAQIRAHTIDEMIRTTSEAFFGLTVGCARCHDHKFDPILQRDYYALYATFAGVHHGSRIIATPEEQVAYRDRVVPLEQRRDALQQQRDAIVQAVVQRGRERIADYERRWIRRAPSPRGHRRSIPARGGEIRPLDLRRARSQSRRHRELHDRRVRHLVDRRSTAQRRPGHERRPGRWRESRGGGQSTLIRAATRHRRPDRAAVHQSWQPLDDRTGRATRIQRVFFSSARGQANPEHPKFAFLADYRVEVSLDGERWQEVANSHDRQPVSEAHRENRLRVLEITDAERSDVARLDQELAVVNREMAAIPPLPTVWTGHRQEAKGPFHVFLGGNPQREGEEVVPASLAALSGSTPVYRLTADSTEGERRRSLADWIVHPDNPLTPRVLANRLWHYHFGTGIVDTPNDFGFMGGRPTHPELLDWLAGQLQQHQWRIKPLHKLIMMSQTYRQSSQYQVKAGEVDQDARQLWRFPPRRLSAEEIRDTLLSVAGRLDPSGRGGPGFRLYRYLQDNVSTYLPLDDHGPETYRRAVYHQNVRASVVDLMTEFDQPDCAFSTPRRAETITPLQALTLLNHCFTHDMAGFLAERLRREVGDDPREQIARAYQLCYGRDGVSDIPAPGTGMFFVDVLVLLAAKRAHADAAGTSVAA